MPLAGSSAVRCRGLGGSERRDTDRGGGGAGRDYESDQITQALAVAVAARLAEELSCDVPWRTGDVVLLDNSVAMHGRRTFTGTRKVLASLIATEARG